MPGNVDVSVLWLYEWKVIKYICIYKLLMLTPVLWIWKHVLQYLPETLEILIYYVFYIILTAINLHILFSKSRKYSFLANLLRKITFFLHVITSNVTLSCYRIDSKCRKRKRCHPKSDFRLWQATYFSTKNLINKLAMNNRRLLRAAEFHFVQCSVEKDS